MDVLLSRLKKKIRQLLNQGSFGKNVVVLAGGTAFGYGVAFIASPLLTRLYSPGQFGVLTVYMSVLGILGNVISLRYPLAIPLAEDDESAMSLLLLSLGISVVLSVSLYFLQLGLSNKIITLLGLNDISSYLWLVPVGVLGIGVYQSLSYWAVRKGDFGRISRTKLVQTIGMVAIQLIFGVFKPGAFGLLVGDVFGRVGGSGSLAMHTFTRQGKSLRQAALNKMVKSAKRYRRFPLISTSSVLMNSAGLQIAPLLLATLYGAKTAGLFALSQRIIGIPMILIGQAVGQVFFNEFAKKKYTGQRPLKSLYQKTARKLALLGALPIFFLAIGGSKAFGIIFGGGWRDAGTYTQILAVMYIAQFVVVPLSQTLNILERQGLQFLWDSMRLVLVILAIYLPYRLKMSPFFAISLYSFMMFLCYLALYTLSIRAIRSTSEYCK